jgi:HNH endonuclease
MPKGTYTRPTVSNRFWKRVNKDGKVHPILKTRCWDWVGGNIRGYGHFWVNGKTVKAHRYSYTVYVGEIPNGLLVLHKCDNPSCVNPDHLFVGTELENRQDCTGKGRQARGNTHGSKTRPESVLRGGRHPRTRLTETLVKKIRVEYVKGSTSRGTYGLAAKYNLSQATIQRVTSGTDWTTRECHSTT